MIPTTVDAIQSLRPGAEFVMYDDDVSTIEWHTAGVKPVTKAEVEAEITRLQVEAAQKAAERAEGLRKMAQASSLTETELAALGL